jgi:hypothetical protein
VKFNYILLKNTTCGLDYVVKYDFIILDLSQTLHS